MFLVNNAGKPITGSASSHWFCKDCFQKQLKIDRLEEENQRLKDQLKRRDRQAEEGIFGLSTPSSRKPFKKSASDENTQVRGGARVGHRGNGRKAIEEEAADEIIELKVDEESCPHCGGELEDKGTIARAIVDSALLKAKNILYKCGKKACVKCGRIMDKKPPVLPRNKYGNNLISNSMVMHFYHGVPLKRIEDMWGDKVVAGVLIKIFHRLAKLWEPAIEGIKKDYRQCPVKHADETGWRTDGKGGYGWLFCTAKTSLFAFRRTRSSEVVKEVLGTDKLPGVLVVDRYGGYNKAPCKIQYCYAHLLRDLKSIEEEFPDVGEVRNFVNCMAPLLSETMWLPNKRINDKSYYARTKKLKEKIFACIRAPAKHSGIQNYQDIFDRNQHRLFHWVEDRDVPSHNNRAERELRPTVIARKVSFGSQSEEGAKTRSILMTVLHTAAKRLDSRSLEEWLTSTLEQFTTNPNVDPYSLLPQLHR